MKNTHKVIGVGAASLVLGICLIAFSFKNDCVGEGPFMMAGTLFSGLAFAGVVWTVLMQNEELRSQQKELALTREVFVGQSATQNKQRFENTFFQLVAVHTETSRRFQYLMYKDRTGSEAFSVLYGEVAGRINQSHAKGDKAKSIHYYNQVKNESNSLNYIPYINNLFNILEMIKTSTLIEPADRPSYYKIVASLLSTSELGLVHIESIARREFDSLNAMGFFDNPFERFL